MYTSLNSAVSSYCRFQGYGVTIGLDALDVCVRS